MLKLLLILLALSVTFGNPIDPYTYPPVPINPQTWISSDSSGWSYTDQVPAFFWETTSFVEDSSWNPSKSLPLGYGITNLSTVVSSQPRAVHLRHAFSTPSTLPSSLTLFASYNDGVTVYINGVEVYRNNIKEDFAWQMDTSSAWKAQTVLEGALDVSAGLAVLQPAGGTNILAIQLVNNLPSTSSSDMWIKEVSLVGNPLIPHPRLAGVMEGVSSYANVKAGDRLVLTLISTGGNGVMDVDDPVPQLVIDQDIGFHRVFPLSVPTGGWTVGGTWMKEVVANSTGIVQVRLITTFVAGSMSMDVSIQTIDTTFQRGLVALLLPHRPGLRADPQQFVVARLPSNAPVLSTTPWYSSGGLVRVQLRSAGAGSTLDTQEHRHASSSGATFYQMNTDLSLNAAVSGLPLLFLKMFVHPLESTTAQSTTFWINHPAYSAMHVQYAVPVASNVQTWFYPPSGTSSYTSIQRMTASTTAPTGPVHFSLATVPLADKTWAAQVGSGSTRMDVSWSCMEIGGGSCLDPENDNGDPALTDYLRLSFSTMDTKITQLHTIGYTVPVLSFSADAAVSWVGSSPTTWTIQDAQEYAEWVVATATRARAPLTVLQSTLPDSERIVYVEVLPLADRVLGSLAPSAAMQQYVMILTQVYNRLRDASNDFVVQRMTLVCAGLGPHTGPLGHRAHLRSWFTYLLDHANTMCDGFSFHEAAWRGPDEAVELGKDVTLIRGWMQAYGRALDHQLVLVRGTDSGPPVPVGSPTAGHYHDTRYGAITVLAKAAAAMEAGAMSVNYGALRDGDANALLSGADASVSLTGAMSGTTAFPLYSRNPVNTPKPVAYAVALLSSMEMHYGVSKVRVSTPQLTTDSVVDGLTMVGSKASDGDQRVLVINRRLGRVTIDFENINASRPFQLVYSLSGMIPSSYASQSSHYLSSSTWPVFGANAGRCHALRLELGPWDAAVVGYSEAVGVNPPTCAVGCDGVPMSGKVVDLCGVCGGDGRSCCSQAGVMHSDGCHCDDVCGDPSTACKSTYPLDPCGVCGGDGFHDPVGVCCQLKEKDECGFCLNITAGETITPECEEWNKNVRLFLIGLGALGVVLLLCSGMWCMVAKLRRKSQPFGHQPKHYTPQKKKKKKKKTGESYITQPSAEAERRRSRREAARLESHVFFSVSAGESLLPSQRWMSTDVAPKEEEEEEMGLTEIATQE